MPCGHYTCRHPATVRASLFPLALVSQNDRFSSADTAGMSQRQVTVLLGFGQLLAWGSSFYLLAILAEPMAAGLALPRVWVYLCFSASLVMAAVLGPLGGQLIDRHGGRPVLMAGNVVFALALLLMSQAQGGASLMLGWLLLGVAMPLGLYDAGFATAVRLFGAQARRSIVGITLIAGFASSVSWPLTHWLEQRWDWRVACQVWAVLHLTAGLALHARLPRVEVQSAVSPHAASESAAAGTASRRDLWLLAAVFACGGFVFASLAAHLPRVLEAVGCTPAMAVAAASIVGAAQVAARLAEAGYLGRLPPMISAWVASALHPLAVCVLLLFGPPAAFVFAALHGAGVGLMTIVKGTLPLHLFGAAGFGRRAGILEGPSRVIQAASPVAFGVLLDRIGGDVIWVTGAVSLVALAGLRLLSGRPA